MNVNEGEMLLERCT